MTLGIAVSVEWGSGSPISECIRGKEKANKEFDYEGKEKDEVLLEDMKQKEYFFN